jgi:hypothetical protein
MQPEFIVTTWNFAVKENSSEGNQIGNLGLYP